MNSAPDTEENLEITPGLGSLNGLKSVGSEDDQSKEIKHLKDILVAGSKNKELTVLQEITPHSATIYRENLNAKSSHKINFHLDELVSEPAGVNCKRTDSRVLFQVLTLKLNFDINKLIIEHHQSKFTSFKERFLINVKDLLGMKLENTVMTIDAKAFYKSMKSMQQTQNSSACQQIRSKWTQEIDLLPSSRDTDSQSLPCTRVKLTLHDEREAQELLQVLESSSLIKTVLDRGLNKAYLFEEISNVSTLDLFKFYPILVDPLLCRAAQLASLELTRQFLNVGGDQYIDKDLSMDDVKDFIRCLAGLQSTFETEMLKRAGSK